MNLQLIAQTKNLRFTHYTIEDGLSSNTINKVMQASDGYLWIGTQDGLFRYDGHHFTAYYHDDKDSNSLCGNFIYSIKETWNQNLLIATNKGLSLYERKKNKFKTIRQATDEAGIPINTVFITKDHKIITASKEGLRSFDENFNLLFIIISDTVNKVGMWNQVLSTDQMIETNDGKIWMATSYGGIQILNMKTKEVYHLFNNPEHIKAILGQEYKKQVCATSLAQDKEGNMWMSYWNNGLFKYIPSKNLMIPYKELVADKTLEIQHQVISIYEDSKKNIWLGTQDMGVWWLNPSTGKTFHYVHDPTDPNSISDNRILSIIEDSQGNIWVATLNGLNMVNYYAQQFSYISEVFRSIKNTNSTLNSIVCNNSDSLVWIGTYGSGLFSLDVRKGEIKQYTNPFLNNYSAGDAIWTIEKNKDNNLLIGAQEGAFIFDIKKKKMLLPEFLTDSIRILFQNEPVTSFMQDTFGDYWFTTAHTGIFRYTTKERKFDHYEQHTNPHGLAFKGFYIMKEDSRGVMWFLFPGDNVIYYFDRKTEMFINFKKTLLEKKDFYNVYIDDMNTDKNGNIWFGTDEGIYIYSILTGNYLHFTQADGLCSNIIDDITILDSGIAWIGTKNGLSKFNLQTKTFRNYSTLDGLPVNIFSGSGAFDVNTSMLFFSNEFNLVYFNPYQLKENKTPPPLYITSFLVNNQERISSIDSMINLRYFEDNITIEFTAVNFINGANNTYYYYLEGLDTGWINAGKRTTVNYSNLSFGNYIFHVKAFNSYGVQSANDAIIKFTIARPVWRQWWFYFLCIIFIGGIIYLIYNNQVNRYKDMEKVRSGIARDLHDDMGSTLSSISILSAMAKNKVKNDSEKTSELIHRISESSLNMMDTMDDIVWSINPENDSMKNIVSRMREFASNVLEAKDIDYSFKADDKVLAIKLTMDKRRDFFLVFKEAINNLAKYSKCKKAIIELHVIKNNLIMKISDDGIGFDISKADTGNGLINMKKRAEALNGSCTISSTIGNGTSLEIIFQIT